MKQFLKVNIEFFYVIILSIKGLVSSVATETEKGVALRRVNTHASSLRGFLSVSDI